MKLSRTMTPSMNPKRIDYECGTWITNVYYNGITTTLLTCGRRSCEECGPWVQKRDYYKIATTMKKLCPVCGCVRPRLQNPGRLLKGTWGQYAYWTIGPLTIANKGWLDGEGLWVENRRFQRDTLPELIQSDWDGTHLINTSRRVSEVWRRLTSGRALEFREWLRRDGLVEEEIERLINFCKRSLKSKEPSRCLVTIPEGVEFANDLDWKCMTDGEKANWIIEHAEEITIHRKGERFLRWALERVEETGRPVSWEEYDELCTRKSDEIFSSQITEEVPSIQ